MPVPHPLGPRGPATCAETPECSLVAVATATFERAGRSVDYPVCAEHAGNTE